MSFIFRMRKSLGIFFSLSFFISGCGGLNGNNYVGTLGVPGDPSYVRLDLTDNPIPNVKSILINVSIVELFVQVNGKQNIVVLANNLGIIDLTKIQNGVFQKLGQLQLPPNSMVNQIRLTLGSGNSVIMSNGNVCQLAAPSAQQSSILIPLNQGLITQFDQSYDLALDFQSNLSINIQNDGSCQFTPTTTVIWATQVAVTPPTGSSSAAGTTPPAFPAGGPNSVGQVFSIAIGGSSSGMLTNNNEATDPSVVPTSALWSE